MKKAATFNMSYVNNNGEYEGGVHITTSDGIDVKSESKSDSLKGLIDELMTGLITNSLESPEEEEEEEDCENCSFYDECFGIDDEDIDAVLDDYMSRKNDNLEEISKEKMMIDVLTQRNDTLQKQLNELQARFDSFENKAKETKSYNSSLNTYNDLLNKYLELFK